MNHEVVEQLATRLDHEWLAVLHSPEVREASVQLQHDLLALFALGPLEIERIRDEVARLREARLRGADA